MGNSIADYISANMVDTAGTVPAAVPPAPAAQNRATRRGTGKQFRAKKLQLIDSPDASTEDASMAVYYAAELVIDELRAEIAHLCVEQACKEKGETAEETRFLCRLLARRNPQKFTRPEKLAYNHAKVQAVIEAAIAKLQGKGKKRA